MNKLVLIITLLVLQIVGTFYINQQYPITRLKVEFLNVGQGDAILIETVNKQHILVDTGRDNRIVEKLVNKLQNFENTIDILILTHSDNDHIGGLSGVLENLKIEKIIFNFELNKSIKSQQDLDNLIIQEGSITSKVDAESDFTIDGCEIDFVWPSVESEFLVLSDNDSSISLQLSYKGFDMFLGGDISTSIEEKIIPLISPVEVMKLNHHGSNTGNSAEFLTALNPKIAVISVGKNNTYHLPNTLVLQRLQELNIEILRTDNDGDIFCQVTNEQDFNCASEL